MTSSGTIRRLLGPMRATLRRQLEQIPDFTSIVNPEDTQETVLKSLQDARYQIALWLHKLNNSTSEIRAKDKEWAEVLETLSGDDLSKEEENYLVVAEQDYIPMVTQADEKISYLTVRLQEVNDHLALITSAVA